MTWMAHALKSDLHLPRWLMGFEGEENEPDLSALEGLSDEDLEALDELADLTPEEVQALAEASEPSEAEKAVQGLKEALRKERNQRRELARENKRLTAEAEKASKKPVPKSGSGSKSTEDDEDDSKTAELEESRQRSVRLAERLAKNAVDTSIIKAAGPFKFKDVDDVLALINRADIDVEQDDDDPTSVEVDEDTVKDALKALAKKKPHLLVQEEKEGGPSGSGSKFGGGRNGNDATSKDALKKKYPALNRRR